MRVVVFLNLPISWNSLKKAAHASKVRSREDETVKTRKLSVVCSARLTDRGFFAARRNVARDY